MRAGMIAPPAAVASVGKVAWRLHGGLARRPALVDWRVARRDACANSCVLLIRRPATGIPGAPTNEVDVEEAKQLIEDGKVRVIDVRTQFRFLAMPGAEFVPLEDILQKPNEAVPTDKPILFICNVGQASGVATQMATALGVVKAYNMKGGMEAWEQAGFDTVEPPADH